MMINRTLPAVLGLGLLASCVKSDVNVKEDTAPTCTGPSLTDVSEDLSATLGTTVELSAKGSTCTEGETATLTWAVASVPVDSEVDTGDLDITDPTRPKFVPDVTGSYVVSVIASDEAGAASLVEYVVVTVASGNSAPIADCGNNMTSQANDRVDFDGSASRDPEGASLEYEWTLASVPDCSALVPGTGAMFNGSTALSSIVPDCAGSFVVALAVSDGEQWSAADYCSVNVSADNRAPVADAGDSLTLSPCTENMYELNGYGSYDPEGKPLSYQWTVVSVPPDSTVTDADFNDATLANPIISWDVIGTYTFQLQVSDGEDYSSPDIVSLTFTDSASNAAPIANAGEDQTISNTTECETASYVFTCEPCPADTVELDATASDDPVDGDELSFLWNEPTGEISLSSRYSPLITATTPSFDSEYGETTTKTWTVDLTVSDCADSDTDQVTITYSCTGEYSP
jgi:hypothetical protein